MSYEKKIDEMVAHYVALYQEEQTLAKEMADALAKPVMAHGYLTRAYHPPRPGQLPALRRFIKGVRGSLSNGVPWTLSARFKDGSLLGIYNPKDS